MEAKKTFQADLERGRWRRLLIGFVLSTVAFFAVLQYDITPSDDDIDESLLDEVAQDMELLPALQQHDMVALPIEEETKTTPKLNIVEKTVATEVQDRLVQQLQVAINAESILTPEEEAVLFERLNDKVFRKAVSVADNIKSRLFRHETLATDIRRIAQASGLDLSYDATKGKSGVIPASAYKTLEALYLSVGESIFTETVSVLGGAWKYDKDAFRPQIIKGLAKFVELYRDKYNKKALIDRLNRSNARDILNVWKISAEHGYKCIGREILAIYNKGTSVNRLPDLFA